MTTEKVCPIRWCKSGAPAMVDVHENIGDGSWRITICQPCAAAIGVGAGHDLPEPAIVRERIKADQAQRPTGSANG